MMSDYVAECQRSIVREGVAFCNAVANSNQIDFAGACGGVVTATVEENLGHGG